MSSGRTHYQSRRSFLETLAAVAGCSSVGAVTMLAKTSKAGLVGSNIYGWGQYAQREGRKLDVDEVISALRDCGYDYLEATMNVEEPEQNARFAEQLRKKGLQPFSLYLGAKLQDPATASESVHKILRAAQSCQQAGFKALSLNVDPIGRAKTDEELKTQASALNELGAGLQAAGMKLGIHHHTPEMANKAHEFHHDFDQTRPEVVGWCYDVHWVYRGGLQPLDALQQYGNRVVSWHLRQSRGGVWYEDLETGDIDYSAVAEYAEKHYLAKRYTVELALENGTKVTRSVAENHRRSRDFVRKVFGV